MIYYSLVIFLLGSPLLVFCCATDIGYFLFTFSRKWIGLTFIAVVSSVYVYARSLLIKPDKFLFWFICLVIGLGLFRGIGFGLVFGVFYLELILGLYTGLGLKVGLRIGLLLLTPELLFLFWVGISLIPPLFSSFSNLWLWLYFYLDFWTYNSLFTSASLAWLNLELTRRLALEYPVFELDF